MDGSCSTFYLVHTFLATLTVGLLSSEQQKRELLPGMADFRQAASQEFEGHHRFSALFILGTGPRDTTAVPHCRCKHSLDCCMPRVSLPWAPSALLSPAPFAKNLHSCLLQQGGVLGADRAFKRL